MTRREFLALTLLLGCTEEEIEMNKKKKLLVYNWLNGGVGSTTPWWLAGGLIPESTSYTIYDPLAAANLADSYINLANPGVRDAALGVSPTHAQGTGWQFNGTTQYLNSQTNFLATHTIVIWQDNWAGVYSAGSVKILFRPVNTLSTRLTTTGNTDLTGPSSNSILGIRAGLGAYRNGKKLANMGAFPAGTDYTTFIGCRNAAGPASNFGSGYVFRYAHYNFQLSDAQMEGLFDTMSNWNRPAEVPYVQTVLGLDPIAYYPMNQNVGKFFIDRTGGQAAVEAFTSSAAPSGITVGHSGPTGKGLAAKGSVAAGAYIGTQDTDWNTITGINMDEFSFACWFNNTNTDAQARILNIYSNSGNEYFALEIRLGLMVIYNKENGTTANTVTLGTPTTNTWYHLVVYNSKSAGKEGIYLNGVKTEVNRTVTGFVDNTPDVYHPKFLETMNGYMNHAAFFDHALSQSEVDQLYV